MAVVVEAAPRPSVAELCDAGQSALTKGDWRQARAHFAAACERGDGELLPLALEGLGAAAGFGDDGDILFDAHERAYRLYRDRDDPVGAGRVATALALDNYVHRGDPTAVRGWLSRARRLLDQHRDSAEAAWLRLWEGDFTLLVDRDARGARRAATEAGVLARALGDGDLEMLALALEGLALVTLGQVPAGMRLLDESSAAATAGEIADVEARLTTCCYLIWACERARDYGRAALWCSYVREAALRHGHLFSLALCRCHYAGLLVASGEWGEAERELTEAIAQLERIKPPWAAEGVCRLAELRRRQGRAAERVAALDVLARAYAATGRLDDAGGAADELAEIATLLDSGAVRGWAARSRGGLAVASGDPAEAQRAYEDAVDHFSAEGMPYEIAGARLALARVLCLRGQGADARREAGIAAAEFRRLGAAAELVRAESVLADLPTALGTPAPDTSLTARETEVLGLLATGRSNEAIAEQLVLSLRTVERHVSNIYLKIGVTGRVARAGAAAYAHRHGLVARGTS